jgi:hypothetical protein
MLADETCWFLAADFDKAAWRDDAAAFLAACEARGVPAALERSRSGRGGHVWIFFAEPVPVPLARRLGAHLVTETMEIISVPGSPHPRQANPHRRNRRLGAGAKYQSHQGQLALHNPEGSRQTQHLHASI